MTTPHTANDNIIENDIMSDTELSEPENYDDETSELVNIINISENFSSVHQSLLLRIPTERFLENLMIFNFITI